MKKIVSSEMEVTLKVIGGKWKPLILHFIQNEGTKRYSEIHRFLQNAPKKTLTAQLKELENDGVLHRTVIPASPIQVEYAITELGKSLFPILDLMCDWGYENMGDNFELLHPTCIDGDKKKGTKK